MATGLITAVEMAKAMRVDLKTFRQALRDQHFPWHSDIEPWVVRKGSPEHEDMLRVLEALTSRM